VIGGFYRVATAASTDAWGLAEAPEGVQEQG
jgi:hypothetical protein